MDEITFLNTGYVIPHDLPINLDEAAPESSPIPTFYKPANIDTFFSSFPWFMQGTQPSCVAHGVTFALMYNIWKSTGKVVVLSPRFLYAICKQNDGIPDQDGTLVKVAFEMAKKYGICEERFFTNNVGLTLADYKDASKIPQEAYQNALQYKLPDYKQITDMSLLGLNKAIYQNDVVLIGMKMCDNWWKREDGVDSWLPNDILPLRPPSAKDPVTGAHVIALYSYGQFHHLTNWWSNRWGYQGKGWYGVNDLPSVYEAFVIVGKCIPTTPPVQPLPLKMSFWQLLLNFFKP